MLMEKFFILWHWLNYNENIIYDEKNEDKWKLSQQLSSKSFIYRVFLDLESLPLKKILQQIPEATDDRWSGSSQ